MSIMQDPTGGTAEIERGGGGITKIDKHVVTQVGQRFIDHAEELRPHAENLKDIDLASAYGPWAEAAKPLEDRVQEIGESIGHWSCYCQSYGTAVHESVALYHGADEGQQQNISSVKIPGA